MLGKLPLFDFPVPLSTESDPNSHVGERALSLLTGRSEEWYDDPFQTAVFVEFDDDEWVSGRDEFDIPHPQHVTELYPEAAPGALLFKRGAFQCLLFILSWVAYGYGIAIGIYTLVTN